MNTGAAERIVEVLREHGYELIHVGWGEKYSLADMPPELRGNVSGLIFTDALDDDCAEDPDCVAVYTLGLVKS